MAIADYSANALLTALLGKAGGAFGTLASPPTLYLGLFITALVKTDATAALAAKEATYAAYARKVTAPTDYSAPSGGSFTTVNDLAWPQATGGSSLCIQAGLCDAASSGNLIAWGLLAPSALKDFQAETEDAEFVVPGHGWSNGTEVRLIQKDASPGLPGGFDANTKYFIVSATDDAFKLSLTSGGAAVTISSDGEGRVGVDGSLNVTNNVTPKIETGNLTLTMI